MEKYSKNTPEKAGVRPKAHSNGTTPTHFTNYQKFTIIEYMDKTRPYYINEANKEVKMVNLTKKSSFMAICALSLLLGASQAQGMMRHAYKILRGLRTNFIQ